MTIVGTIGRTAIVPDLPYNITFQRSVSIIHPKHDIINVMYLKACLDKMQSKLEQLAHGSSQKGIYLNQVKSIIITIPPIELQNQFADFVRQVDKSKLLFQQMVSKYDELVKSRFIEMFKPFMNEGHLCMLEKLTNLFTDGNWIESKDQSQSGIRLIQTGNIGNAQYLDKAERSRFIDEETFVRLKCTEVVPGDVLVSRLPDPIGRSCIVPTDLGTMITGVDCTIIRFTDKINPVFFITYTLTDQYKSQIIEFEAGSTRKRISRKNLGKILVPVPPIELQNQFADFVKQVDKSKSEILEGIKRLKLQQIAEQ